MCVRVVWCGALPQAVTFSAETSRVYGVTTVDAGSEESTFNVVVTALGMEMPCITGPGLPLVAGLSLQSTSPVVSVRWRQEW